MTEITITNAVTASDRELGIRIAAEINRMARHRDGVAEQAIWAAEDGWRIGYTTSRIEGGPHDGKFAALAYKPIGKGARTNPESWERVYMRPFATRKAAKARALALYAKHSPKWAHRHGRTT